jgi:hypothetical protein
MNEKIKIIGVTIGAAVFLTLAAVTLAAGIYLNRQGLAGFGDPDLRYAEEHGRAAEIIGRLTVELERERELNRELLDHNRRAREIAGGLTDTAERNVQNLQDAIGIIGEIRKKLKVLADFHSDSGSDGGGG